ncbi:MAG: FUSC family protein [Anaerovoracaceae bacterium]
MKEKFSFVAGKTILFVVIVLLIIGLKSIFGNDNVIVSVGLITQALCLLSVNLTNEPVRNLFKIVALNVTIGVASTVVQLNPFLGFVINFGLIFFIVFVLMRDLATPTYFSYMLTYCFMMATTPVSFNELPLRLVLLALGGVFTMVLQYTLNGGKSKKASNLALKNMAKIILKQIDSFGEDGQSNLKEQVGSEMSNLAKTANERKKNAFFVSPTVMDKMNIAICFERISLIINSAEKEKSEELLWKECLGELRGLIYKFKNIIDKKIKKSEFKKEFEGFLVKYNGVESKNELIFELLEVVDVLQRSTIKLQEKRGKHKVKFEAGRKPKELRIYNILRENFRKDSIRMSFAFRSAFAISTMFFVYKYFDLEYGRWLVYTNLAIIQPYASEAGEKLRDRIKGTIVGFLIFIMLFGMFQDSGERTVIIMLVGYLAGFKRNYFEEIITTTISAMGIAAMSAPGDDDLTMYRILFVFLGGCFAMVVNRFIMHCTIEGTRTSLVERYKETTTSLFSKIFCSKESVDGNDVANTLLTAGLIADKLELINTTDTENSLDEFISNQRKTINDIMFIAYSYKKNGIDEDVRGIIGRLIDFMQGDRDVEPEIKARIKEAFSLAETNVKRTQIIALGDILKETVEVQKI